MKKDIVCLTRKDNMHVSTNNFKHAEMDIGRMHARLKILFAYTRNIDTLFWQKEILILYL